MEENKKERENLKSNISENSQKAEFFVMVYKNDTKLTKTA